MMFVTASCRNRLLPVWTPGFLQEQLFEAAAEIRIIAAHPLDESGSGFPG
jgi:hypothetical protein